VIVTGGLTNGLPGYEALVSYNASTGETQWTATPGAEPIGLVIDPRRKMVFVGGNRTVGYSVAHGTVLWTASWAHGSPTAIGLSADGARLFETGWNGGGSTTVAYHT
jgi:hypothetical protein